MAGDLTKDDPAYEAAYARARQAYVETLGGEQVAVKAQAALEALHAYAQASDAMAGASVVAWFAERHDAAQEAYRVIMAAHFAERRQALSQEPHHD
jgi:hypothetical protein